MMGFDEWMNKRTPYGNVSIRQAYEAGAASRQAEVDCLKVELDAANERSMMLLNHKNKMVDKLQGKVDELQKRIDDLTNTNESLVAYKNQLLDEIKGKENEN